MPWVVGGSQGVERCLFLWEVALYVFINSFLIINIHEFSLNTYILINTSRDAPPHARGARQQLRGVEGREGHHGRGWRRQRGRHTRAHGRAYLHPGGGTVKTRQGP